MSSSKSACRPMCVGKVASGASRSWFRGGERGWRGLWRCHTNQLQPFHCPVPRAQSADKQIAGKWATIMLLANVGSPPIKPVAQYTKKRFLSKSHLLKAVTINYLGPPTWKTPGSQREACCLPMSVDRYMVSEQATVIHSAVHAWKPLKPLHSRSCLAW